MQISLENETQVSKKNFTTVILYLMKATCQKSVTFKPLQKESLGAFQFHAIELFVI